MNNDIKFIWQLTKYGSAKKINTTIIKKINLLLSIIIVGLYPIPIAILINKLLPNFFIIRYNKRK